MKWYVISLLPSGSPGSRVFAGPFDEKAEALDDADARARAGYLGVEVVRVVSVVKASTVVEVEDV